MAVYVSIHDVSPEWSAEVEDALDMCARAGARAALLVVPDFHRRAPLRDHPRFCERLRDLQARGHELLLHGYYHQSGPAYAGASIRGRLAWLFAQRVVTSREAEMSDISLDEGRTRVEEGERVLREVGLRADGYVAPGWSMPAWMLPLLAARGYRYCEDHLRIYDPVSGRSRPSVVLNWATRSPGRVVSTIAWCRVAAHARRLFPTRIAIHPADLGVLAIRREIARALDWAKGDYVQRAVDLFS